MNAYEPLHRYLLNTGSVTTKAESAGIAQIQAAQADGARVPPGCGSIRSRPPSKQVLDTLHLRKIDMADEVLVVNPDGYIGACTAREIDYAWSLDGATVVTAGRAAATRPSGTGRPATPCQHIWAHRPGA